MNTALLTTLAPHIHDIGAVTSSGATLGRTLITGATSGLGRRAVDALRAWGIDYVATGRNQTVGSQLINQGIDFIPADLGSADEQTLMALLDGSDTVWHGAALSAAWGRYDDFYHNNVIATERLAQMAAQMGVRRFVYVSTPSVYFDYHHRYDVAENDLPAQLIQHRRAVNHYATTKYLAELAIADIATHHLDTQYVILRPRAIFGAYDRVLLPKIIKLIKQRGKLPLPRGGAVLMDLSFDINVIYAMYLASVAQLPTSATATGVPTYNITNGEPIRLAVLLERLFTAMNAPFAIKSTPYPLMSAAAHIMQALSDITGKEPLLTPYSMGVLHYDMTLDITRATHELGYAPIVTLDDAIRHTAGYFAHDARR